MATEARAHEVYAANAGSDLTGKLFLFAKLDSSGNIIPCASAGENVLGVIVEENTSGKPATVQYGGIGKVTAGGTLAPNDRIATDGTGKAVHDTTTTHEIIGIALDAGSSGDVVRFLFARGHVA